MTAEIKHYAILNSSASFDQFKAKEALDVALILASYEMKVSLFFIGEGVFQSQASQQPEMIKAKDFISTFKALDFYDIENIYISEPCLKKRQLSTSFAFNNACLVDHLEMSKLLNNADIILSF